MYNEDFTCIRIDRPVLTQRGLDDLIGNTSERKQPSLADLLKTVTKKTKQFFVPYWLHSFLPSCIKDDKWKDQRCCSAVAKDAGLWILSFLPFVNVLRKYEVKSWLINDVIAGLTVGIMHVPQGMAYAMLATLPPIHGLYTSFFPPLVYFFFGTSRHISLGTIAVISLLTGEILDKKIGPAVIPNRATSKITPNETAMTTPNTQWSKEDESTAFRVMYASAAAALVGIIQLLMGYLRLGGLTRYLPSPMISAFTVGVAVHVFTSQLKTLLGVVVPKPVGLFAVPCQYYELFKAIGTTNVATFGLSLVCIVTLVIIKQWINPRIVKRIKIPIPIDLLIVITTTVVSYTMKLNESFQVQIIGHVSTGIPHPVVPAIGILADIIDDVLVLAIVAIFVTMSLSRIFAKSLNYKLDCNQELFAYGLSNIFSSFFQSYPSAASLSRSVVQVSTGGKTQVATLFSSALLILVLYFIGPLFYNVPNCSLSAIIIVALKGMFLNVYELKTLWKYSIWDFIIWIFTFLATVILDVRLGLLSGVLFSAMTIILRTQAPPVHILDRADGTEFYYSDLSPKSKSGTIRVVRYEGNIYYACAEHFRRTIFCRTAMDPAHMFSRLLKIHTKLTRMENLLIASGDSLPKPNQKYCEAKTDCPLNHPSAGLESHETLPSILTLSTDNDVDPSLSKLRHDHIRLTSRLKALENDCVLQHVILDCSCWTFIDFVGADELKQLIVDYEKMDVSVSLAQISDKVVHVLRENGKLVDSVEIFPSIHDAYVSAKGRLKETSSHLQNIRNSVIPHCLATCAPGTKKTNCVEVQVASATKAVTADVHQEERPIFDFSPCEITDNTSQI